MNRRGNFTPEQREAEKEKARERASERQVIHIGEQNEAEKAYGRARLENIPPLQRDLKKFGEWGPSATPPGQPDGDGKGDRQRHTKGEV